MASFASGENRGKDLWSTTPRAITAEFFGWKGNSSCLICACSPLNHMYLFVYVKCTWEFMVHKEKHFSFHHSCTFSNPKEASPKAARCLEDGLYDREQLRLPLFTEPSGAWLSPVEASLWSATSIKNITSSPLPSCRQQSCLCVRWEDEELTSFHTHAHSCFFYKDANTSALSCYIPSIFGLPWIKLVPVQIHPTFGAPSSWAVTQYYRLSSVSLAVSVPMDHW